ncbi:MAG: chromosomal replication initiator protein DnaA [Cytophagales bacterium]|nr:chromosomal replication initiator protein DnaA [Bernardetiaceae bacterium]MDW8205506.1 chromosomal replication initiator protein DnaA [Cytophagales bacterium]
MIDLKKPSATVEPSSVSEASIKQDHNAAWRQCLSLIMPAVGEQAFQTWFQPIVPLQLTNNVLVIQVPNHFFYEWLEEHYVHILKRAIVQVLGVHGKLEYSIVVDQNNGRQPYTLNIPQNIQATTLQRPVRQITGHSVAVTSESKELFDSNLNPRYTFDNFIEGECNRLARAAGISVASKPGFTSFNPFLVYSGFGLGKTHLIQAIGNEIKRLHPYHQILYITSEDFIAQFVDAVKLGEVRRFVAQFQRADTLIIDDVQFFGGKDKSQEQFFHIFNHLHQNGKQIIMSSDCAPKDMKGLMERLLSRFKWGATIDLQAPDYHTRIAIVQTKLNAQGIYVPDNVVDYLAQHVTDNIRTLESVITTLALHYTIGKAELTLELAKTVVAKLCHTEQLTEKRFTVAQIQQMVAEHYYLKVSDLLSASRKPELATPRQIAMYLCAQYTEASNKMIASQFGGKDQSTISHACKAVQRKMQTDESYKKLIGALKAKLNNLRQE